MSTVSPLLTIAKNGTLSPTVLEPPIPRSVRFAEAPAVGLSVLRTANRSKGAQAYRAVALGLLRSWKIGPGRRAGIHSHNLIEVSTMYELAFETNRSAWAGASSIFSMGA